MNRASHKINLSTVAIVVAIMAVTAFFNSANGDLAYSEYTEQVQQAHVNELPVPNIQQALVSKSSTNQVQAAK